MTEFRIGISCIGSGVGQSVVNSLKLSRMLFHTIGLGNNPMAYGVYDCDTTALTKGIYEVGFIDDIIEKCKQHRIDLIIPGHDDEVLIFSEYLHMFHAAGVKVICPDYKLVSLCRDKEKLSAEINKVKNCFVKSFQKDQLLELIEQGKVNYPLIAKPRDGQASRGVNIIRNKSDIEKLKDNFIIQQIASPHNKDPHYSNFIDQIHQGINHQVAEISIQLVFGLTGNLLGKMCTYNKLRDGIPIEILPYENPDVWAVVDSITPFLLDQGLKGPINIQGRMTDEGLKLFEINPRFTGITGLRALMGFNEVETCVKEWLSIDQDKNFLQYNALRFGTRQIADKSISLDRNPDVRITVERLHAVQENKKKVLFITGACGYLGRALINKLADNQNFELWLFDLDKNLTKNVFSKRANKIFCPEDIVNGRIPLGNVDILIHLAFTRPHGTKKQIASSLKFSCELFSLAAAHQIPAIINISSQSVYGQENDPPWVEQSPVAPETLYAQAKFATEVFLENIRQFNKSTNACSIRLGSLAGGSDGLVEVDVLSKFVRNALSNEPIQIVGGMQEIERLDIRDAADALYTLICSDSTRWKPVYNLSSGQVISLKMMAEKVIKIASEKSDNKLVGIIIDDKPVHLKSGMNCKLFFQDMNWQPNWQIEDTIESLVKYFSDDLDCK